jgi:hypothetical protein
METRISRDFDFHHHIPFVFEFREQFNAVLIDRDQCSPALSAYNLSHATCLQFTPVLANLIAVLDTL